MCRLPHHLGIMTTSQGTIMCTPVYLNFLTVAYHLLLHPLVLLSLGGGKDPRRKKSGDISDWCGLHDM